MMNRCKIVVERVWLREPSLEIRVKNMTLNECKIGQVKRELMPKQQGKPIGDNQGQLGCVGIELSD